MIACTQCGAPCREYEWAKHNADCLMIDNHEEILAAVRELVSAQQVAADDQLRAWQREQLSYYGRVPGAATPEQPTPHSPNPWERRHPEAPVPTGKVKCAHCNGITEMYPNCGNCGGKGWIEP